MRLTLSSFSEAVRRRRRALGFTQTDLARHLGMTRQWIAKIETDSRDAPLAKVIALADLLGLELEFREPDMAEAPYAEITDAARLAGLLRALRTSAIDVPTAWITE